MSLARRLHEALQAHQVRYCQWKGHADPDRWIRGDGDLDLLVARGDAGRLASALADVGFKPVVPPAAKQIPGTESYYGVSPELEHFVHIHVHYHLRLGHYRTMNYHLPLEDAVLSSAATDAPLRVPAPELEFLVFVVRMVLGYSLSDALTRRAELSSPKRAAEWEYFASRVTQARVREAVEKHLPGMSPAFFDRCVRSLSPTCSMMTRLRVKRQLARLVRARRAGPADTLVRLQGVVAERWARVLGRRHARNRLKTGGLLVAVLGGDGSGKSTAVRDLRSWLAQSFETGTIHLGKPPRSIATLTVAAVRRGVAALGIRAHHAPLLVLRSVCIARDRYRLYMRACRQAAAGTIVICDRYPTTFIRQMDGPNADAASAAREIDTRVVRLLQRRERDYYNRILPPDLAIVLRVDPDVAAARKVDEPPDYVRARARAVWDLDLTGSPARIVDANRPRADVASDLRSIVWSRL